MQIYLTLCRGTECDTSGLQVKIVSAIAIYRIP